MPKYYIATGSHKAIKTAETPHAAARLAFAEWVQGEWKFGAITMVNQTGFDSESDDDMLIMTDVFTKEYR